MYFRNDIKTLLGFVGLAFVLTSCTSATFPEIVEDEPVSSQERNFNLPSERKVLKESSSLGADEQNAAYDGQQVKKAPEKPAGEKVAAAKTKPVIKKDLKSAASEKKAPAAKEKKKSGIDKINDKEFKNMFKSDEGRKEKKKAEIAQPSVTYRLDTFYFANGSSVLDGGYNARIRDIVRQAKAKKAVITVYGYASSRTRNTDIVSHKLANFNVSMARAENVAAALRRAGLPAKSIKVEALSDSNPAYLEVMPEGERLNRRAEVYISY